MLGRTRLRDIGSLDEVIGFVESSAGQQIVICDVDNTLAPQDVSIEEFAVVVNAAIDRLEAHPGVARVIALTNGPEREVSRLVSRGNKPWTTRKRLGLRGNWTSLVVVGDQVLTDGLLSWRLRAPFLHLVLDDENESTRQAAMRRIGRGARRLLFREMSAGGPESSWEPR